ncbi:MAG: ORF6N domain-containing protein [Fibrella sp.]|nr:ORF6N domain-containing protein [Armatimonadota bacterium]
MTPVSAEPLERYIFFIRGQRVILSADLADLYEVVPKVLVQAVKRNIDRFPADFMFQLTHEEFTDLKSQFVTSSRGGTRYLPYAFTEQGVAMLSSVLRSPRAVAVNIEIMRAFVRMRHLLTENVDMARRLDELEAKTDKRFQTIFDAIRQLMTPPPGAKRRIGYRQEADE